eukprot:SM000069S20735  [mRNA]  locus=s69:593530:595461:- [translate_table: standard]
MAAGSPSAVALAVAALCLVHAAAAQYYTGPVSADPKTWLVANAKLSDKHNTTCPTFSKPSEACTNKTCGSLVYKAKFQLPQAQAHRLSTAFGVTNLAQCCSLCRTTVGCSLWMWELQKNACTLLKPTVCTQGTDLKSFGSAGAQDPNVWFDNCEYPIFVGGLCNPGVKDDPHFTGARGTRFDFNGIPDQTFCLLSDRDLHVNMKLSGYLDSRTTGATIVKNGKALRTWIRQLGLRWRTDGIEHTALFVARTGKQQERGGGYLAALELDGVNVAPLQLGDKLQGDGGAVITFAGYEKTGPYDVDFYTLTIPGILDAEIRLRAAHPLLQTKDDAEVHINLQVLDLQYTPAVHGVLGQTYRDDHRERALKYSALVELMGHRVAADADEGKGFLDGSPSDYKTSSILAADCKFARYATIQMETTSGTGAGTITEAADELMV